MDIRLLAASFAGPVAAAGEVDRAVHIWNVSEAKSSIVTLDTVLDFGGSRLAITEDGAQCVAGAYVAGGVASYCTTTGKEAWCRPNLRQVQQIGVTADDQRIICCFDEKPCLELDRDTGKTIRKLERVERYWTSSYEFQRLLSGEELILENLSGRKIGEIPRETFAVLSVAFGPGMMCITESGGPVRCFDTQTGKSLWRFMPDSGEHFLELGFVEHANVFAGICWPYKEGGSAKLFCFEPKSGDASVVADLGKFVDSAFCLRGSRLLLSDGSIIDSATGARQAKIQPIGHY